MAESGFLRSATFGGYDKKDVLNYVDKINQKIFMLENELEYVRKKLADSDEAISAKNREIDDLKKKMREQYYNS